jgi:hypothetical protein
MGWITIDIRCEECDLVTDILIDRDEQGGTWGCPDCGGPMSKTLSAPNFTRASYVDGTKRKGFAEMKEAVKVEREMMDLPPSKREEHQKLINKLKGKK